MNNFIDNASSIDKLGFLIRFSALSLNWFENNYLTGSVTEGKGYICQQLEQGKGNIISTNWFDYTEGTGIYPLNTEGHVIKDNFFQ